MFTWAPKSTWRMAGSIYGCPYFLHQQLHKNPCIWGSLHLVPHNNYPLKILFQETSIQSNKWSTIFLQTFSFTNIQTNIQSFKLTGHKWWYNDVIYLTCGIIMAHEHNHIHAYTTNCRCLIFFLLLFTCLLISPLIKVGWIFSCDVV